MYFPSDKMHGGKKDKSAKLRANLHKSFTIMNSGNEYLKAIHGEIEVILL